MPPEWTMATDTTSHDLIVIGATAGGLSVAEAARRAGVERVHLIERGQTVLMPDVISENELSVTFGEIVSSVDVDPETGLVTIVTDRRTRVATACVIAEREVEPESEPPIPVVPGDRVSVDLPPAIAIDADVMVIGVSDHAVELTMELAKRGAGVVLAADGMDPARLSPVAGRILATLERERRATVLYRSSPSQIGERNGYPIAYFSDRHTPDLEFDHVVFATSRAPARIDELGVTERARASDSVLLFSGKAETIDMHGAFGPDLWPRIAEARFPDRTVEPAGVRSWSRDTTLADELAEHYYNATITKFEPTHTDLWRLNVKPDHGDTSHLPGQYATLGLGYWESRIDDAIDVDLDDKWLKMVRRSYSISNSILDTSGYLTVDTDTDELEFYIVLVNPSEDNVPGLTPRLALKRPGDRIFLGSKVAGRYTLAPVVDPGRTCIFLSTGTGEAPHNAMVNQLLRKGHHGPIISAVTVRQWSDLGYLAEHRELEKRYDHYHYMPLPTREDDVPKTYLQDVIRNDAFNEQFGVPLDPAHTDVFLCGNPAMIGLPESDGDEDQWPEVVGVTELLVDRGFTLDRRGRPGNIHFEEYW